PQVMLNGLKTDLYDYIEGIPTDLYEIVKSTPNVDPLTYINGYSTITPDKSQPPFDDLYVRKALHHALDKQAIAKAVYGNELFYELDGALFSPEQEALYSEQGTKDYLAYDQTKAKKLLRESTYNGDTLTIIYANDTGEYGNIAEIVKQQLEA